MIKTFGLHWDAEKVIWSRPSSLLGIPKRSRSAKAVDFKMQRGIYALYANYELVYIGQTGSGNHRLFNRLKSHRQDHLSERWNRFSWFGTRWVTGNQVLAAADAEGVNIAIGTALNVLEAISIGISEPRLNLSRGRWEGAIKYFQYFEADNNNEDETSD